MRDSSSRFSHCRGGEPTGDETPLDYGDDDGEQTVCPVCGYVRLDGRCAECNGRRIEALVAAREGRTLARVLRPVPRAVPLRHAA